MVAMAAILLLAAIVIPRSSTAFCTSLNAISFSIKPRQKQDATTTTTTIPRFIAAGIIDEIVDGGGNDTTSSTAPQSSSLSSSSLSSISSSLPIPRRDVLHRSATAVTMGALVSASLVPPVGAVAPSCGCCRGDYKYNDKPRNSRLDRFFSYSMSTGMDRYEDTARPYKARLFRKLFDSLSPSCDDDDECRNRDRPTTILEVGMGAFPNAPYYAEALLRPSSSWIGSSRGMDIIGVDPNDYMFDYARESAARAGLASSSSFSSGVDPHHPPDRRRRIDASLRTYHGVAESLPFATGSIDAVVSTLTLCSVVDQKRALSEINRVLRPRTGRYLFWEHVISEDDRVLAFVQGALSPLQTIVADGCHLDRRTGANIFDAGFMGGVEMEYATLSLDGSGGFGIIGPTVFGIATA
ncbi:hypothetical protein ACHAXA_001168 [Cyclostephanos tholiformis]|uniref:Methyltransferase type 11 domain-containing protein n=1 Tax=Cyclostephanos tholiformis TaxID=382380 RepID=A0ABD3R653_9STRA